jgi:2-polyprenyl-3-methyl-5-hydroxy-6-metoxy-1,4-benzoquinol methylase
MSEICNEPCPSCYLCGKHGRLVHARLIDKLFGAPGAWNFKECPDKECGLFWMDPKPTLEDLPKAYASYYTHGGEQRPLRSGPLAEFYRRVKLSHLNSALGYKTEPAGRLTKGLSKLLVFFPERRNAIESEVMFLAANPGGKLLDVGCGSGERLERLQSLGWTVSGIDFDAEAVRVARGKGLDVYCGTIPGTSFPTNGFDAIIMNHVIEHLPDPVVVLKECERILKPGGKVVISTPNSSCLGHKVFKEHWRGLEPPRHLHVFSPSSVEQTLKEAGFSSVSVRTLASAYLWEHSLLLKLDLHKQSAKNFGRRIIKLAGLILNSFEHVASLFNASAGECLWVVAVKGHISV